MHIMEGFLPAGQCIAWGIIATPFLALGVRSVNRRIRENPELRMLLGVAAAFVFILSALKLPSVTGSCSHPTGTGLGAILFGPTAMAPIGFVVLLFQALLLAHGGLTTLGANMTSMAIAGPFISYGIFRLAGRCGTSQASAVFLAAALGDLATYVVTSAQLALAFPDPAGGFMASFLKFGGIFAITQIPLAISEGLLTVLIFNALQHFNARELLALGLGRSKTGETA